jgi:DNA-directed RNA polymerase omega subunit
MKGSDLEGLLGKLPSKYAIAVAVGERAKQLELGARPLVDPGNRPLLTVAIDEIRQDKVKLVILDEEEVEDAEVFLSPKTFLAPAAKVAETEAEPEPQPEPEAATEDEEPAKESDE